MPSATFFLLPQTDKAQQLDAICAKIAALFRQHKNLRVYAASQEQAEALDEALWQTPADSFIPHQLSGEAKAGEAPVEITWEGCDSAPNPRAVLFNLAPQVPTNAQRYQQIYDIVPADDSGKQQARERYKHYRANGYQMQTLAIEEH
ncbi:DNA polymerase III subunit chi [Idiomarina tyrosinivorans]|uniref:DNA polymerase III subunit chi n=1 Tax=Idiomarina tyrosinivorans TaxID=1445662 RepID=A0A432ZG79_9GAMM|nr:DNA polymerase III subunit chi [Idiomarina tyrosinivorans]RUO76913.1 DNA polymerase III subunit chi [Idiomarina tyrosinivorans]